MIIDIVFGVLSVLSAAVLGYGVRAARVPGELAREFTRGKAKGFEDGKATGWLEHYEETVKRDRERRDRRGRFIAVKAKETA